MRPYSSAGSASGSAGLRDLPGRPGRRPRQVAHDLPADGQRVLVIEGVVVGDARLNGVHLGAAELLRRHHLAGRGLHQRRAAEKDRAGALHDDRLVAHRGHVGAARGARPHHQRHLRDPLRRELRLVVEDAAEVLAIGKDLVLERQEGAAGVDEIEARQPVLERDLLGAEVLLHGHRVVRAALDRRVVGDDDAGRPLDTADAGDDPRARRIAVIQALGRERVQLEEGAPRVEEPVDPFADGQLAALPVPGDRPVVTGRAPFGERPLSAAEVVDQGAHRLAVGLARRCQGVVGAAQDRHRPDYAATVGPGGRVRVGPAAWRSNRG